MKKTDIDKLWKNFGKDDDEDDFTKAVNSLSDGGNDGGNSGTCVRMS